MMPKQGKWSDLLTYDRLLRAFQEKGCPVCFMMERNSQKDLRALFYEKVTDYETREYLSKSRGFCNWHAWMSLELKTGESGLSLIYQELLEKELVELKADLKKKPSEPSLTDLLKRIFSFKKGRKVSFLRARRKAPCPICVTVGSLEKADLHMVLDSISEEEFLKKFKNSFGLCRPHLHLTLSLWEDHPNLPLLIEVHLEKFRNLLGELGEYIRKFDYRYAHEPKGPESDSWIRAVRLFVGGRGLFGSDL